MTDSQTGVQIELPRYQCHKKVWALKLKGVAIHDDGKGAILSFENGRYSDIPANAEWVARYKGDADDFGWFIQYEDGFVSWTPSKVFEEGYTRIDS